MPLGGAMRGLERFHWVVSVLCPCSLEKAALVKRLVFRTMENRGKTFVMDTRLERLAFAGNRKFKS